MSDLYAIYYFAYSKNFNVGSILVFVYLSFVVECSVSPFATIDVDLTYYKIDYISVDYSYINVSSPYFFY